MRTTRLVLIAAVLAPAVGCNWMREAGGGGDGRVRPGGPLPQVGPDQLVGYLNDRAGRLQSIEYGNARVRVSEKGVPVPATLTGPLACSQPRNFRLRCGGTMGGDVDLGSNPDIFWVYVKVPSEKPMYVFASHSDFEAGRAKLPGGIPFEPDWVMQALGMMVYPTTNQYAVKVNERDRTYVLNWPATTPAGLQVKKEVVFDGDAATGTRPQVKRHLVKDAKSDKVLVSAEVKSVNTATAGTDPRTGQPAGIQYPTHVVLRWEEQKFEMDLTLERAQVNPAIGPEQAQRLFTRPNIPGANPIDLARYEFR